jgi:hypothetical protein
VEAAVGELRTVVALQALRARGVDEQAQPRDLARVEQLGRAALVTFTERVDVAVEARVARRERALLLASCRRDVRTRGRSVALDLRASARPRAASLPSGVRRGASPASPRAGRRTGLIVVAVGAASRAIRRITLVRLPPISLLASNGTSACAQSESRQPSQVNQLPNAAPTTVGALRQSVAPSARARR